MPRPPKERRICMQPRSRKFHSETGVENESVLLNLDELETIRLLDLVGLSQEAAGDQMQVGRATVQRIYEEARRKIADALIYGKSIEIENERRSRPKDEDLIDLDETIDDVVKSITKICVPLSGDDIHPRFGLAPRLKMLEIRDRMIVSSTVIDAPVHQHGELPGIVARLGVDAVIVHTLGQIGIDRFNQFNVSIYSGLKGNADEAVQEVLSGKVRPNARASGHCLHTSKRKRD